MTIRNTNFKSREAFLSAFLCHVRDETQIGHAIERSIPSVLPHGSGDFYGRLTEKGIRVRELRRFGTKFPQRVFTGVVEEDANGVVIKGTFRFGLWEKLLYAILLFAVSLIFNQDLTFSVFFVLVGCPLYFFVMWISSLSSERNVKAFLSELE